MSDRGDGELGLGGDGAYEDLERDMEERLRIRPTIASDSLPRQNLIGYLIVNRS